MRMALVQGKVEEDLDSRSFLADGRTVRLMESYGISRREARTVIAAMDSRREARSEKEYG